MKQFSAILLDLVLAKGLLRMIFFNPEVTSPHPSSAQVLALVGDQLDHGHNICGAVLSIRFNEDILSIWNRNASDHQAVMALRDAIKRQLKLPHGYVMEYKAHDASLRDNSSYRNTWLRG
ncbi:eukaryotic translation initiation factor NCBP-like [Telopea speciosissima]|uniref:eukaryotic translation initiation factor NCBP-like n=1 Tax=Telopea speciosissima TaxID=54955 RepID=UPI001CC6574A|nr:eukaryotic translation initiation factor NCBP-like [Telopea speciosissima]